MTFKTADEFFAWRETERRKHRTMTAGEYVAWCRGGDAISSPQSSDSFPGGLTILFGPNIIGRTDA